MKPFVPVQMEHLTPQMESNTDMAAFQLSDLSRMIFPLILLHSGAEFLGTGIILPGALLFCSSTALSLPIFSLQEQACLREV